MTDIGNRCVHCGEDTSFGSGRFVNRIPADADYEATDSEGNIIFADGEYRDGYACPDCMCMDCDRCDKPIPLDEDMCPHDVYDWETDDRAEHNFSDGSYRVHLECLTKKEKTVWKRNRELGVV